MIHYSCDCCKRLIDSDDLRYVIKMEVSAAMDPVDGSQDDDDNDGFEVMQEILRRMEDAESDEVGEEVYQQLRYDLCSDCTKKFRKNPLGREVKQFDFSNN